MRTVLLASFLYFLSTFFPNLCYSSTSGYVEIMTSIPYPEKGLTIDGNLVHSFNSQWSFVGFFLVKPGWAQARLGAGYRPTRWFKIGFTSGLAQGTLPKLPLESLLFGVQKFLRKDEFLMQ